MRFTETYDELKACLKSMEISGEWQVVNSNQIQFRHRNGGVMNWYPSTGSLTFQGRASASDELRSEVARLIGLPTQGVEQNDDTAEIIATSNIDDTIDEKAGGPAPEYHSTSIATEERVSTTTVLGHQYSSSELVIGLVGAVGAELKKVEEIIRDRLKVFQYNVEEIRISKDVIPTAITLSPMSDSNEYVRINEMMNAGNKARRISGNNAILALGAASLISTKREENTRSGEAD
jgi:hypothetical protein